jgi:hypothetical protein
LHWLLAHVFRRCALTVVGARRHQAAALLAVWEWLSVPNVSPFIRGEGNFTQNVDTCLIMPRGGLHAYLSDLQCLEPVHTYSVQVKALTLNMPHSVVLQLF